MPLTELPAEWRPAGRTEPLLFAEFPALRGRVPWMPLAHVPTAVEPLTGFADYLGTAADLWHKRDDLISPLYGGNKVRRYEHVLADALARGASRIVATGGIASTQVTATALFGKALDLAVRAVLFDQPVTAFARAGVLADAAAGAELIYGGGYLTTFARTVRAYRRDRAEGNYLILPGAANALANLGYIDAMLELARQVEQGAMPRPDAIVLPTGSSGTLAALALGAAYLGWPTEIVGVRITARIACNRTTIGIIARNTARYLAERAPGWARRTMDAPRFSLHHGAIGPGYGYPTDESVANVERVRALTGEPGEVTYSAKALAGLRAVAHEPRWRGKTLLLWQTLSAVRPASPPEALARVPRALHWVFEGDVPV